MMASRPLGVTPWQHLQTLLALWRLELGERGGIEAPDAEREIERLATASLAGRALLIGERLAARDDVARRAGFPT
jgi:hypothetical protein